MTDKELLELAAKAAGIDLCWNDAEAPGYYSDFRGMPQWEYWNPIVFDGDALRLAVTLRLQVVPEASGCVVYAPNGERVIGDCRYSETRDLAAATRCAIVRAAAEIGRAMP